MDRAVAIANEFLALPEARGGLTQMQLQKLAFIANGWNLAINGDRLISDDAEAWDYGPVFRDLYEHTKFFGTKPINRLITADDDEAARFFLTGHPSRPPYRASLTPRERSIVEHVWSRYGRLSGPRLSMLTHERGTPWRETFTEKGKSATIPESAIRAHYLELAKRAQAAAA